VTEEGRDRAYLTDEVDPVGELIIDEIQVTGVTD